MKKTLLYSLAVLASVTLASCNGDYDDWANPQTNPQEASAAKYGIKFLSSGMVVIFFAYIMWNLFFISNFNALGEFFSNSFFKEIEKNSCYRTYDN